LVGIERGWPSTAGRIGQGSHVVWLLKPAAKPGGHCIGIDGEESGDFCPWLPLMTPD